MYKLINFSFILVWAQRPLHAIYAI